MIIDLVGEVKEGNTYIGEIVELKDFGALVQLSRAQEAILHISELTHDKVLRKSLISDLLAVGQKVNVKVNISVIIIGYDTEYGI